VTATNSGGATNVQLTITVNDVPPSSLTYGTNPAVYVKGTTITANGPSSSGGAVVSYGISPALPTGLNFNATTGVVSGTATVVSGQTSYTVTATNSGGATNVQLTITVNDVPSVSAVQFGSATFGTSESTPEVIVAITRSGSASNPASVDYTTGDTAGANNCKFVNGVASSRCDYLTTVGTVHFAANENSKTISIPIIDDAYVEGSESFTISLSNPTGVALGTPSTSTVTISDNDTVIGTNQIDQAEFFVREHYVDFLNRQPDAGGLAFWSNEITSCGPDQLCTGLKRINVSAAYFLSIEFQGTGYLVERIYKTAYGDATGTSTFGGAHQLSVPIVRLNEFLPDTQAIGSGVIVGQTGWEQALENNKQAFNSEFVQRPRFTAAFPSSMTPAQFVDTLNANAGNPLSGSERNQLVSDLSTNAKTRAQVLRAVAEDQDLNNAEFNRAFVLMQFFGYLRRNPNDPQDTDYSGYDFWLTKLNQFNGNFVNADMVKAFINSTEYRNRFGP
jgi:hypothetical protein